MSKYILKVNSYRKSGKWYHEEESVVEFNSYEDVFKLENDIKINAEYVRDYSGLTCGFDTKDYNFVIKIEPCGEYFMNFILS